MANVPRTADLLPGDPRLIPEENRTAILKGQGTADDDCSTQTRGHAPPCPAHGAPTKSGSNTELKGLAFTGFAPTTPGVQGELGDSVC